ncbi:MAG: hypothetical protein GW893_08215 [Armatimonadetes bacterium]|nr:hypothetical protein [Armatimonadota bacterium]
MPRRAIRLSGLVNGVDGSGVNLLLSYKACIASPVEWQKLAGEIALATRTLPL